MHEFTGSTIDTGAHDSPQQTTTSRMQLPTPDVTQEEPTDSVFARLRPFVPKVCLCPSVIHANVMCFYLPLLVNYYAISCSFLFSIHHRHCAGGTHSVLCGVTYLIQTFSLVIEPMAVPPAGLRGICTAASITSACCHRFSSTHNVLLFL